MPNLACGRVPSHACSVCACFNAGFIGSGWAWHLRAHASLVGPTTVTCDRWACPPSGVTADPARCLGGRGRRSKVRPCQLMRQTTPV